MSARNVAARFGVGAVCIAVAILGCNPKDRGFLTVDEQRRLRPQDAGNSKGTLDSGVRPGPSDSAADAAPAPPLNVLDGEGTGLCDDSGTCTCNGDGHVCDPLPICDAEAADCGAPCPGCSIDGACVGNASPNPDNPCESCDPARDQKGWSDNDGIACDDGAFCTAHDQCRAGACAGTPLECDDGVACNGLSRCDEAQGVCVPGTSQCDSTSFCDVESGTCATTCSGCAIAGVCIANGSERPGNPCLVCDTSRSTVSYSAVAGKNCGSASSVCSGQDTCDANGSCLANDFPSGTGCGSTATGPCDQPDACDGNGACAARRVANGARCSDGQFCTVGDECQTGICVPTGSMNCGVGLNCSEGNDRCQCQGCLIGGNCFAAGALNGNNTCQICNPTLNTTAFSPNLNAACGSQNQRCDAQARCVSPPANEGGTCGTNADCAGTLLCTTTNGIGACCPAGHVADASGAQCRPVLARLTVVASNPNDPTLIGALQPAFSAQQINYSVDVSFWATQIGLGVAGPSGSTVLVNGAAVVGTSAGNLPLSPGNNTFNLVIRNAAGRQSSYALVIRRREPIRIPSPEAGQRFGSSLTAAGDVLVVGDFGSGTVYTFRRTAPGRWEHQANLALRGLSGDGSTVDSALSFDGTTLAVGAYAQAVGGVADSGALHLYQLSSGWTEVAGSPFGGGAASRESGWTASVSGASAAAGSANADIISTYSRDSNRVWRADGELRAPVPFAFIEGAVAVDGNVLLVGAHNATPQRVFVYQRSAPGVAWSRPTTGDQELTAFGLFGNRIAFKGQTLVAAGNPVSVFERGQNGVWSRTALFSRTQRAITLSTNTIVTGMAEDEFSPAGSDQVYVYRRSGASWVPDPVTANSASPLPHTATSAEGFGAAFATVGPTVFVGAPADPPGGAVYVYE